MLSLHLDGATACGWVGAGGGGGSDMSGQLALWRGVRATFEGQAVDGNKVTVEKGDSGG